MNSRRATDLCVLRLRHPGASLPGPDPETFPLLLVSNLKLLLLLAALVGLLVWNTWGSIFLAGYLAKLGSDELVRFVRLVRGPS